ncbi:hypothetical protein CG740_23120 [Streptomyces sp. CB01201]|uniref:hypothetical protein n=1 Tax=Streptomyces sp. CB01201 TaxID=2020324 RepID=UPI000C274767|nr:hypothetical protein [Streptomyces sp. CB01201]PJN00800.1 hypothetical protein CG740_23120 [Streptomyces sp. CB01201]
MRLPKLSFRIPRSSVSDVVDLAGLGCLVGAAWWWVPVVGLVVTGLVLLLIGWVVGNEPDA